MSKTKELTSARSGVLGGILVALALFFMFGTGLFSEEIQVYLMGGIPLLVLIVAIAFGSKKSITQFAGDSSPETEAGNKIVNIIGWVILLALLLFAVIALV